MPISPPVRGAVSHGLQQSYQLHIRVKKRVRVTVGTLGSFSFAAGLYVYTGSARRNIASRVHRHLSTSCVTL